MPEPMPDLCNLPHQSTDEEDRCDRQHYARGGWVSGACDGTGPVLGEFGCTFRMPSRAQVHAAWSDVRAARMNDPDAQAGYQAAADQNTLDSKEPS